jgi:hypothetical protein
MIYRTAYTKVKFGNNTVIGLQSKTQPDYNLQLVKVVIPDGIYIKPELEVELYRISLETMSMYMDSKGKFRDCIEKLDENWYVYIFDTFDEFFIWYKETMYTKNDKYKQKRLYEIPGDDKCNGCHQLGSEYCAQLCKRTE